MVASPFKFLDSYNKNDKDIFFGREQETEELYARVFIAKTLLVYGVSGTGKSSLIQCGLSNKFSDSDWLPLMIRRGTDINKSVLQSISKLAITPLKQGASLTKSIQSIYLDHFKPIYLIFDQFEELFIFGTRDEQRQFIEDIHKLLKSETQCKIIFIIREEYLASMTAFEEVVPEILNNRIRIERMSRTQARQVVEGPCRVKGIALESGFSEALLDKLSPDGRNIELTYLQVYLDKIFRIAAQEQDQKHLQFSIALLNRLGNVGDLLGAFLEEQVAKLADPEMGLSILKSFVSTSGTKRQLTMQEMMLYLKAFARSISDEKASKQIKDFCDLRILRDKDEYGRYELRHDALAAKIYEKITLAEKEILEIRQFIEQAFANYQKRQILLSVEDLLYISPYKDKLFLSDELQVFLNESRKVANRKRRRRRVILLSALLLFVISMSSLTIWALREKNRAVELQVLAEQQKNEAIRATREALLANKRALTAKQRAELNEKLAKLAEQSALSAKEQAENSKMEAVQSQALAVEQSKRATMQSQLAKQQAERAENQKKISEQERMKAERAEGISRQLTLNALAQNLALKSIAQNENPALQGLLALEAYQLNRSNGGQPHDPVIYEASRNAFTNLNHNSGQIIRPSSNGETRSMSWSDALNGMVAVGKDGLVNTLDIGRGKSNTAATLNKSKNQSAINYIRVSRKGKFILSGHVDYTVSCWTLDPKDNGTQTFKWLNTYKQKSFLKATAINKEETSAAMLFEGVAGVTVMDLLTGKTSELKSQNTLQRLAFTPDGKSVLCITSNGDLTILALSGGNERVLFEAQGSKATSLETDPTNNIAAVGFSDGKIHTYDLRALDSRHRDLSPGNAPVENLAFDEVENTLAASYSDKSIRIFFLRNVEQKPLLIKNHQAKVRCLSFAADHKLVAGCDDKNCYVWETATDKYADRICGLLKRNLTAAEWQQYFGGQIPYRKSCRNIQ